MSKYLDSDNSFYLFPKAFLLEFSYNTDTFYFCSGIRSQPITQTKWRISEMSPSAPVKSVITPVAAYVGH